MRAFGLLNPALVSHIARLGHMDTFVIADCGLPIPKDIPVVDLSLVFGVPRFKDVLDAVLAEVVVEGAIIATQTTDEVEGWITDAVAAGQNSHAKGPRMGEDFFSRVDHAELKELTNKASFVIRTGETTPYANVIFSCGVPF